MPLRVPREEMHRKFVACLPGWLLIYFSINAVLDFGAFVWKHQALVACNLMLCNFTVGCFCLIAIGKLKVKSIIILALCHFPLLSRGII